MAEKTLRQKVASIFPTQICEISFQQSILFSNFLQSSIERVVQTSSSCSSIYVFTSPKGRTGNIIGEYASLLALKYTKGVRTNIQ